MLSFQDILNIILWKNVTEYEKSWRERERVQEGRRLMDVQNYIF